MNLVILQHSKKACVTSLARTYSDFKAVFLKQINGKTTNITLFLLWPKQG